MKEIAFISENFSKIAQQLNQGTVAIFPSDTSYGFSASPFIANAITDIQKIKGRPEAKPFLLLVADFVMAQEYADFSPQMAEFAKKRWSQSTPTTVLVRKKTLLSDFFPEHEFVGIRVPQHGQLSEFLKLWEQPLISTSANLSGAAPLFSIEEIRLHFGHSNVLFVNAGDLPVVPPSEIWTEQGPELVRLR